MSTTQPRKRNTTTAAAASSDGQQPQLSREEIALAKALLAERKASGPPPAAGRPDTEEVRRDRMAAAAAAAGGASAAAAQKKRWRPIGSGLFEMVNTSFMLFLIAAMLCYAWVSSRPLHHLMGEEIAVEVDHIIDGDTFAARTQSGIVARFRLRQVDAPEKEQHFFIEAKEILTDLLLGSPDREVILFLWEQDDWGRYIVDAVTRDGVYSKITFVQEELVKAGGAWAFGGFSKEKNPLQIAMEEAKSAKRGLWARESPAPVEPWRHRHRQRLAKQGKKRSSSRGDGADQRGGDGPSSSNGGGGDASSRSSRSSRYGHSRSYNAKVGGTKKGSRRGGGSSH